MAFPGCTMANVPDQPTQPWMMCIKYGLTWAICLSLDYYFLLYMCSSVWMISFVVVHFWRWRQCAWRSFTICATTGCRRTFFISLQRGELLLDGQYSRVRAGVSHLLCFHDRQQIRSIWGTRSLPFSGILVARCRYSERHRQGPAFDHSVVHLVDRFQRLLFGTIFQEAVSSRLTTFWARPME